MHTEHRSYPRAASCIGSSPVPGMHADVCRRVCVSWTQCFNTRAVKKHLSHADLFVFLRMPHDSSLILPSCKPLSDLHKSVSPLLPAPLFIPLLSPLSSLLPPPSKAGILPASRSNPLPNAAQLAPLLSMPPSADPLKPFPCLYRFISFYVISMHCAHNCVSI